MASTQKTIEILFLGVDQVSGITASVAEDLGGLNSAVSDITQPFADLAANVLKTDAALAALAAGGLALAFKASSDFETSVISLDKIMEGNVEGVNNAKQAAIELSNEYGQSARSVLDSTTNFKKAGFDIESAMLLAKDSMDLVIAGEVEAGLASEILISTLKGFGAEAGEASKLVGILNGVSNNYATNVEQLGIGMSKLSPIASQMGFSFEETAGLLTPVIEVFRSGDEAAVAYRTGLLKLVDDAKPVAEGLAAIGVSQKDANGDMRSGRDIYYDVAEAFKTLDENQKLVVASQLVGIRQAAKLVIGFDGIAKTIEVTNTALASHDSALSEVEKRLASAEIAVERFKTGFTNLGIVVGDQFLEASKGAIEGGVAIESALTKAISAGTLDPIFDALRKAFDEFGSDLQDIAAAIPEAFENLDFSDFLRSINDLTGQVGETFDQFDVTTPEGLQNFLQFMLDGISSLINVTTGMVDAAGPFVDALFEMVQGFTEMGAESQKSVGDFTGLLAIINNLTGVMGTFITALGGVASGLQLITSLKTLTALKALNTGMATTAATTTAASAASAGLFATLGPLIAALAAVGIGAYAIKDSYDSWQDAERELESSLERGKVASEKLAAKYAAISDQTGIVITNTQEFHDELNKGTIVLNKTTGEWEKFLTAEEKVERAIKDNENALVDWADASNGLVDAQGNVKGSVDDTRTEVERNTDAAISAAAAYYELQGNTKEVALAMAKASGGIDPVSKKLKEVAEASDDAKIKMLELASDERIKAMEFTATIEVADIESAQKQVEAAFSSIDNSFSALTSNIGGLFDTLTGTEDFGDKWAIEDQIAKENEQREETAKLQKEQIELANEAQRIRNQQARDGGGEIKISAEGVEPALEMVLWEIIKKARIRVIEEEGNFLNVAP